MSDPLKESSEPPAKRRKVRIGTQETDLELEAAVKSVPPGWWDEPQLSLASSEEGLWDATARTLAQMQHFTLVLFLHVPYILRDLSSPRFDYSKTTCVKAARDLLRRFVLFRTHSGSAYSCRRVDY
ncbi:unnamed protein product [Discula destructiva]